MTHSVHSRMTAADYAFISNLRARDHGLGTALPMHDSRAVKAWSRHWIMPTPCRSQRSATRMRFRVTDIGKGRMREHEAALKILVRFPSVLLPRA